MEIIWDEFPRLDEDFVNGLDVKSLMNRVFNNDKKETVNKEETKEV